MVLWQEALVQFRTSHSSTIFTAVQVNFVVINYLSTAKSRVPQRLLKTRLWRPTRHVDLSSGFVTFKSISLLEILWFCWFSTPYLAIFSPWYSWVAWVRVLQRIRAIFFGIWSSWSATVGRACFPILVIFTWFCNPVATSWCGPKVGAIQWIPEAGKTSVKFSYVYLKCYQWLEHRRLNMSFSPFVLFSDYSNKGLRIETMKPLVHWLHFKGLFCELNNYPRTISC